MMDRRGFLKFLGTFAAASALPISFSEAKIATAPAWAKNVMRFSCAPLEAGSYTFSAYAFGAIREVRVWDRQLSNEELISLTAPVPEYLGLYVSGVKAEGGETVIEIPYDGQNLKHPRIIQGAVTAPINLDGTFDMRYAQLERGIEVTSYYPF
jgi:hypothetical protein